MWLLARSAANSITKEDIEKGWEIRSWTFDAEHCFLLAILSEVLLHKIIF
jgi:hypothetical protein